MGYEYIMRTYPMEKEYLKLHFTFQPQFSIVTPAEQPQPASENAAKWSG